MENREHPGPEKAAEKECGKAYQKGKEEVWEIGWR
jgi:hypothetical protein